MQRFEIKELQPTSTFMIKPEHFPNAANVEVLAMNYPFRGKWIPIRVIEEGLYGEQKTKDYLVDIQDPNNKIKLLRLNSLHSISQNKFHIGTGDEYLEEYQVNQTNLSDLKLVAERNMKDHCDWMTFSANGEFLECADRKVYRVPGTGGGGSHTLRKIMYVKTGQFFKRQPGYGLTGFIGNNIFYNGQSEEAGFRIDFYLNSNCFFDLSCPQKYHTHFFGYENDYYLSQLSFSSQGKYFYCNIRVDHPVTYSKKAIYSIDPTLTVKTKINEFKNEEFLQWLSDDRILMRENNELIVFDPANKSQKTIIQFEKNPKQHLMVYENNEDTQYEIFYYYENWGKIEIKKHALEYKLKDILQDELSFFPKGINKIIANYIPTFFKEERNLDELVKEQWLLKLKKEISLCKDYLEQHKQKQAESKLKNNFFKKMLTSSANQKVDEYKQIERCSAILSAINSCLEEKTTPDHKLINNHIQEFRKLKWENNLVPNNLQKLMEEISKLEVIEKVAKESKTIGVK